MQGHNGIPPLGQATLPLARTQQAGSRARGCGACCSQERGKSPDKSQAQHRGATRRLDARSSGRTEFASSSLVRDDSTAAGPTEAGGH